MAPRPGPPAVRNHLPVATNLIRRSAPVWWTLADAAGSEVHIATATGRDSRWAVPRSPPVRRLAAALLQFAPGGPPTPDTVESINMDAFADPSNIEATPRHKDDAAEGGAGHVPFTNPFLAPELSTSSRQDLIPCLVKPVLRSIPPGTPIREARLEPLHITVGASHIGSDLSLETELRLLKAAVLYGDKVKLCSLGASFAVSLAGIINLNERQRIDAMKEWSTILGSDRQALETGLALVEQLRRKRFRSRSEVLALATAERTLAEAWKPLVAKVNEIVSTAGAEGLVEAHQAGLLQVEVYDFDNVDAMVTKFFESVGQAVLSGETFPLFDDKTGNLVRAAAAEGKLPIGDPATVRGKVVGLASEMLRRLPLFDSVSMTDLLAIRGELDPYLVRFRSAMISYAKAIETAQWEVGFEEEAALIFREKVAPAIQDIQEAVRSSTLLKSVLARSTQSLTVQGTSSFLGLLLSGVAELSDIAGVALGFGVGTAAVGGQAVSEWRDKHQAIERNQLYFYYKAGQELQNRRNR